MELKAFQIQIPQRDVDELYRRLRTTRWAEDFGNTNWVYGVEREWLEEMVDYWHGQYDWRQREAVFNQYPHYRVEIDGIPIHFVHVRGKGRNPRPLVLTHGWPWTFWDFKELISPLTDPVSHGGSEADAFDLVIPSLPGFGFSTPLRTAGVDIPRIGRLWNTLMTKVLGYPRYSAAGGDWGASVTAQLGHAHSEHLLGVFMTLGVVPGVDFTMITPENFDDNEQWMRRRNEEALPLISSHIAVHTHDPQTLAYALADSPVGTAAWIWERRRTWSDCGGDLLQVYSRDFLCDLASIYWLTGSIGSSLRLYFEHFKKGTMLPLSHDRKPAIAVPTGYAIFPKDVSLIPRSVAAAHVNLKHWAVMPSGGHFGPAEKPELVLHELRTFFRSLM